MKYILILCFVITVSIHTLLYCEIKFFRSIIKDYLRILSIYNDIKLLTNEIQQNTKTV